MRPSSELEQMIKNPLSAQGASQWEWRTFPMATLAGRLIDFLDGSPGPSSAETYLLSAFTPHSVKIRDGGLEIKRMIRMNDHGLELWESPVHASFPIDWEHLQRAWAAWGLEPAMPSPDLESVDDLMRHLVANESTLHAVTLTKRRTPLKVLECRGELVEVAVNGRRFETVAFADVSAEHALAAVAYVGLTTKPNINYPTALKSIIGMQKPMESLIGARA